MDGHHGAVAPTVSLAPGSFVFRVTGAEKAYAFRLPAAAVASTEEVILSIMDAQGRTT